MFLSFKNNCILSQISEEGEVLCPLPLTLFIFSNFENSYIVTQRDH